MHQHSSSSIILLKHKNRIKDEANECKRLKSKIQKKLDQLLINKIDDVFASSNYSSSKSSLLDPSTRKSLGVSEILLIKSMFSDSSTTDACIKSIQITKDLQGLLRNKTSYQSLFPNLLQGDRSAIINFHSTQRVSSCNCICSCVDDQGRSRTCQCKPCKCCPACQSKRDSTDGATQTKKGKRSKERSREKSKLDRIESSDTSDQGAYRKSAAAKKQKEKKSKDRQTSSEAAVSPTKSTKSSRSKKGGYDSSDTSDLDPFAQGPKQMDRGRKTSSEVAVSPTKSTRSTKKARYESDESRASSLDREGGRSKSRRAVFDEDESAMEQILEIARKSLAKSKASLKSGRRYDTSEESSDAQTKSRRMDDKTKKAVASDLSKPVQVRKTDSEPSSRSGRSSATSASSSRKPGAKTSDRSKTASSRGSTASLTSQPTSHAKTDDSLTSGKEENVKKGTGPDTKGKKSDGKGKPLAAAQSSGRPFLQQALLSQQQKTSPNGTGNTSAVFEHQIPPQFLPPGHQCQCCKCTKDSPPCGPPMFPTFLPCPPSPQPCNFPPPLCQPPRFCPCAAWPCQGNMNTCNAGGCSINNNH